MYNLSNEQIRALSEVRTRFSVVTDQMTTTWKRDDEGTMLMLMLVSLKEIPLDVIAQWTDEQCQQAENWAHAVHLCASDNDIVVPPRPEFLKPYEQQPGDVHV